MIACLLVFRGTLIDLILKKTCRNCLFKKKAKLGLPTAVLMDGLFCQEKPDFLFLIDLLLSFIMAAIHHVDFNLRMNDDDSPPVNAPGR